MKWGLYVHIPFCRAKCRYCDFPSYAGMETLMPDYAAALGREIKAAAAKWCPSMGKPQTIYIGGGTPTFMGEKLLGAVIEKIMTAFGSDELREFTVETNPGTTDAAMLKFLRRLGVNRLSIGVQSFNGDLLKTLGRIHRAGEAERTITGAKRAGFNNISLDLMYGLPGQDLTDWQNSLSLAVSLGVKHISAYGLQVEENTEFYRLERAGKLNLPAPETEEAMYDFMTDFLPAQGYGRYEISNFALPGYESRHNLGYWQNTPYLGIGAAAHSYMDGRRWHNTTGVTAYIAGQRTGEPVCYPDDERSLADAMAEFAFLALRTSDGISKKQFRATFGQELYKIYGETIKKLVAENMLAENAESVRLTKHGAKWGNRVFAAFLPE